MKVTHRDAKDATAAPMKWPRGWKRTLMHLASPACLLHDLGQVGVDKRRYVPLLPLLCHNTSLLEHVEGLAHDALAYLAEAVFPLDRLEPLLDVCALLTERLLDKVDRRAGTADLRVEVDDVGLELGDEGLYGFLVGRRGGRD